MPPKPKADLDLTALVGAGPTFTWRVNGEVRMYSLPADVSTEDVARGAHLQEHMGDPVPERNAGETDDEYVARVDAHSAQQEALMEGFRALVYEWLAEANPGLDPATLRLGARGLGVLYAVGINGKPGQYGPEAAIDQLTGTDAELREAIAKSEQEAGGGAPPPKAARKRRTRTAAASPA